MSCELYASHQRGNEWGYSFPFLLQSISILCYTSTMKEKRHNIYFPEEMHEAIKRLAKKECRSFNKQCLFLLKKVLEQEKEKENEVSKF